MIFDGNNYTIQLPEKRCDKTLILIKRVVKQKTVLLVISQKLTSNLQHVSFVIPGGSGFFSPLEKAMQNDPPFITISTYLRQTLMDWKIIIQYLKLTPTSVLQLVTDYPTYMG